MTDPAAILKIVQQRTDSGGVDTPSVEYRRRRDTRANRLEGLQRIERAVSLSRLGVMVLLFVSAWLSLQNGLFALGWASLPLAVFLALVLYHRRVLNRSERARRSVLFYDDGLARIEDRWQGRGKTGEKYLDEDHLYTSDLDIFGPASLFELLATTRTGAGDDCLARWLREPASKSTIEARQGAVEELRSRLDFREDFSALGGDVDGAVDVAALIEWAEAPVAAPKPILRLFLGFLAAGQVSGVVAWAFLGWGPTLLLPFLLGHSVLALVMRKHIRSSTQGAAGAGRDLALVGRVLARIESEEVSSPRLVHLQQELATDPLPPARHIRRLVRLADFLDSARNPFFVPFALLLVWVPQLALAMDSWRTTVGKKVGRWIATAGEVEALAALAAFAFENPLAPFAEIVDREKPLFEGTGLAHPLLPRDECVVNDARLDTEQRCLLVSGSNMSGKSTFLRTVGINAVLALAGAPVRADHLRLTELRIGASIQIHDSLQDGHSRFYREILRMRDILRLREGDRQTLFLLDEILHGTNSHDRRLGAEAILRSLIQRKAIGLVTTHDLALARICEDPAMAAINVHFEDEIIDGKMIFDYRLRPGVVQKSNAIALMRQVGLEV